MGGERLIELDEAHRIEAELSAELPADPEQAAAIVKRRLSGGGADLQRRIASAYQGVTDAWSLGITSIPAVVVDQRYVVSGEPDVARAVARIEPQRGHQHCPAHPTWLDARALARSAERGVGTK